MDKITSKNKLSAGNATWLRTGMCDWTGTALVIAAFFCVFEAMPLFAHPGPEEHRPIYELDRIVAALEESLEKLRYDLEKAELAASAAERNDPADLVADIVSRVAALEAQITNTPPHDLARKSPEGDDMPEGDEILNYALGAASGGMVGWLLANYGSGILEFLRGLFGSDRLGVPRRRRAGTRSSEEKPSTAKSDDEPRKPDELKPRQRVVTHSRKGKESGIVAVGNPSLNWSPRTVEQVHEDIADGIEYFSIGKSGKQSRVLAEVSSTGRQYLTTKADGVDDNNLENLPDLP